VTWEELGLGVDWHSQTVTSIVQEIVNREGWSSGNALTILMLGDTTNNYRLRMTSHDGDDTLAAKLDITYASDDVGDIEGVIWWW
jgi:hypothetical protein